MSPASKQIVIYKMCGKILSGLQFLKNCEKILDIACEKLARELSQETKE